MKPSLRFLKFYMIITGTTNKAFQNFFIWMPIIHNIKERLQWSAAIMEKGGYLWV